MRTWLVIAVVALGGRAVGDGQTIVVHPDRQLGAVHPYVYGHFLEHIYNSVVDGLWGQLIRGPGFEEYPTDLGEGLNVINGGWCFDDDALVGNGVDAHVIFGDHDWTDYTFTVEARKDGGREGFLILFRALDFDNFYWWNLGGWGNKYSSVEHEVNGKRVPLVAETRTETTIAQGRWYDIAIKCAGPTVECYLDGECLATFRDVKNGRGAVGLGAWATDVRYRNARVVAGAKTLFELHKPEGQRQVSGAWRAAPADAEGMAYTVDTAKVLNSRFCQRIASTGKGGGIAQQGLALEAGAHYRGSVWLRGHGTVAAALDGVEKRFDVDSDEWREFPIKFTPRNTTDNATFALTLRGSGEVWVDLCTLYRADTPYRPAVFEKVKAIRPTFIRWPGGCYAEHYRWKDGIGPAKGRLTKPNMIWGGLDPNLFGTAEFIQLCRDVDAEPLIVLNIGHHEPEAELEAYIQEALDWVEYCNGDTSTCYGALRAEHGRAEPFDVLYWEIGNETWRMGVEGYAARAKRFVDALREKDPRLKYLVCGSAGHNLEWNRRIIELAATHMDYLSVHHYMAGMFKMEMQNGVDYPEFLHETAKLIAQSAKPDIKIAVTEWNEQSTALRTGLYAGLVLNGFERYGDEITMACPALFIRKVTAPAWDNAFVNHDSNRVFVAPNYLVMKMYRDNFAPVRVHVEAPEALNVMATLDPDTSDVILKVVNPSQADDVTVKVAIEGRAESRFEVWRVHSADINDRNSIEEPDRIRVVETQTGPDVVFPAHSVTVLRTTK